MVEDEGVDRCKSGDQGVDVSRAAHIQLEKAHLLGEQQPGDQKKTKAPSAVGYTWQPCPGTGCSFCRISRLHFWQANLQASPINRPFLSDQAPLSNHSGWGGGFSSVRRRLNVLPTAATAHAALVDQRSEAVGIVVYSFVAF